MEDFGDVGDNGDVWEAWTGGGVEKVL